MFIHEPWKMNLEEQTKYSCILGSITVPIVDHKRQLEWHEIKFPK